MRALDDTFYQKILYSLIKCETEIPIGEFISSSRLQQITYHLKSAYPATFHLVSFTCEQSSLSKKVILHPQYICTEEKYIDYREQVSKKIRCVKQKLTALQDPHKQEVYVHDYLCSNVTYFDDNTFSHCLVGPLLFGRGVCDGISQAAQFLLKNAGIQGYVIFGEAQNALVSNFLPHAWNVIEIDKKWYHLDVTFDLSLSDKSIRYDYYNLSTAQIKKDHRIKYIPSKIACNSENDYYFDRNLVFSDCSILRKYFDFAVSKKQEHFQFRIDKPYNDSLYKEILSIWESVIRYRNLTVTFQISVNRIRSVFAWDMCYR